MAKIRTIVWPILLAFLCHGTASSSLAQEGDPGNGVPIRQASDNQQITQLGRQLEREPDNHALRRRYADVLYEAGFFNLATDQYLTYLEHYQGTPLIVHRLLISMAALPHRYAAAEDIAKRYLELYPTDAELWMRLGSFQMWRGNGSGAREAFDKALQLNPLLAEAQRGLDRINDPNFNAAPAVPPAPPLPQNDAEIPALDERRFSHVHVLLNYRRYFNAYEQLMLLAKRHDTSYRWLALYETIDRRLEATPQGSPAYEIDRLSYLLAYDPAQLDVRYQLFDALLETDRLEEAHSVLVAPRYVNPASQDYLDRLMRLDEAVQEKTAERIETLEAWLETDPRNPDILLALAKQYQTARRVEEAQQAYHQLLELHPENQAVRLVYAQLLRDQHHYAEAFVEARRLLDEQPGDTRYQLLYARTAMLAGTDLGTAERYLMSYLEDHPQDADVMLDAATLYLALDNAAEADRYIRKAFTWGPPADPQRLEALDIQVERALTIEHQAEQTLLLVEARRLAQEEQYAEAFEAYETYFAALGRRPRPIMAEIARTYALAGDMTMAISILEALQQHGYDAYYERDIARYRYYLQDHAGAIAVLEPYLKRYPQDMDARMLLQQIYLEVNHFRSADTVYYHHVRPLVPRRRLEPLHAQALTQRITLIERKIDTDYVGLIVPISQYTSAKGTITRYQHWAQGLLTQITLPTSPQPFVFSAGLISHFQEGTRRLAPGTGTALSRINQVVLGAYFDLTPPFPGSFFSHTNRLSIQTGLFDYAGARTLGFADLQYLRQVPGKYNAELGLRSTEGGIALWSPAGGEFGLRLTQATLKASTPAILADSTLLVTASIAFNSVTGAPDSTATGIRRNQGAQFRLEASYRIFRKTHLGISFNNIDYQSTIETYFSPNSYQVYDAWLEYQNEVIGKWHVRARVSTGITSFQRQSLSARVEADVTYRFMPQLSLGASAMAGHSSRVLDGAQLFTENQYNMALFSASLYWTLRGRIRR